MSLSIRDLLFLTLAVAIVILWSRSPPTYQYTPDFDDLFFTYSTPTVPKDYEDKGRLSPNVSIGSGGMLQYADGDELFRENHYNGWRTVVINFINKQDYWRVDFGKTSLTDLSDNVWDVKHLNYASSLGHKQAIKQIDALISVHGEEALRTKLKRIPWYRPYIKYAYPVALVLVFVGAIIDRVIRWKYQANVHRSHGIDESK